jgi:hypothetical protein
MRMAGHVPVPRPDQRTHPGLRPRPRSDQRPAMERTLNLTDRTLNVTFAAMAAASAILYLHDILAFASLAH